MPTNNSLYIRSHKTLRCFLFSEKLPRFLFFFILTGENNNSFSHCWDVSADWVHRLLFLFDCCCLVTLYKKTTIRWRVSDRDKPVWAEASRQGLGKEGWCCPPVVIFGTSQSGAEDTVLVGYIICSAPQQRCTGIVGILKGHSIIFAGWFHSSHRVWHNLCVRWTCICPGVGETYQSDVTEFIMGWSSDVKYKTQSSIKVKPNIIAPWWWSAVKDISLKFWWSRFKCFIFSWLMQ